MRLIRDLIKSKIGDITQHDTKGRPHLPHHDETTSNGWGGTLGCIDGDCRGLGTNAYPKDKASNKEMRP
jgi:hypothetical protein